MNCITYASLTVSCLIGHAASAQLIKWTNPDGGNWFDSANWAGGNIPDVTGESAEFALDASYTVLISGQSVYMSWIILSDDDSTLISNESMFLRGNIDNDGHIIVRATRDPGGGMADFRTKIRFNRDSIISGSGTITLESRVRNIAQLETDTPLSLTIEADQTIQGNGIIGGNSAGTIINEGLIQGSLQLGESPFATFINNGTVIANNPDAPMTMEGHHTGSGTYHANDESVLNTKSANMTGVTLSTSGSGVTGSIAGYCTLTDVVNLGTFVLESDGFVSGAARISSNFTNNGNVIMRQGADAISGTSLVALDNMLIDGTGIITLGAENAVDQSTVSVVGKDFNTLTIGAGQTLRGSGSLGFRLDSVNVGGRTINKGVLDPSGSFRLFNVASELTLHSASRLRLDLGGLTPGSFDRLTVQESIVLGGALTIRLDEGYEPQFGDTWNIIDGGEQIGSFETVHLPETNVGHKYRVIYGQDLTYLILTCEADLTGDSLLDSSDITAFVGLFNAQALEADRNSDGVLNFFDIAAYLNEFALPCD